MNNNPNTFTMPVEPLQNGWNKKWDYEALEIRLELNKNAQGYTVRYAVAASQDPQMASLRIGQSSGWSSVPIVTQTSSMESKVKDVGDRHFHNSSVLQYSLIP